MATVNITIPAPIIVAPAYFQVRYRLANPLIGPPTWIPLPNQTNAPFTITGVTQGDWELGVVYVNAAGESCAEVIYPFEVGPPCECLDVGDVTVQREVPGGPVYLKVFYAIPVNPAGCGYIVRYAQAGLPPLLTSKASVYFNPLPAPPITIPVPGLVDLDVEVLSDCCEGNAIICYSATIIPEPEPEVTCVGITTLNTSVTIVQSVSNGKYYLNITFPGPTIPSLCNGMYSVSTQIGVMSSFGHIRIKPGELVNHPLYPTDFYTFGSGKQVLKGLNPSPDVDYLGIRYGVALHDCCGNVVYFPNVVFAGVQIP